MWLTSKLTLTQPPPEAVARPRLDAMLDRWPRYRLVLVRAAAGYGKSSLVSLWASRQNPATIGWLSLDNSDADPVQFVRYVAAALDRFAPGVRDSVDQILQDTEPNAHQAMVDLLARLGNDTSPEAPHCLLILDDYHRARSESVDALMALVLERAPARLHLMVLTRDLPTLPLARLMVTDSLLELTGNELRFDENEIAQFLQTLHMPTPDQDALEQIMQRSEGWVAGLKLAGLSTGNEAKLQPFLDQLHGASQWQAEYMAAEVLSQQSPEMRRFLLQTSILNRFTAQLCEATTALPNAAQLLLEAQSAGLFLISLDNRRTWYRYHHLFQEMLHLQLIGSHSAQEIMDIHRRAAMWHRASGDPNEAVDHYLAAGDTPAAAALLEQMIRDAFQAHDSHRADILLHKLPDNQLDDYPQLLIHRAWHDFSRTEPDVIRSTERAARALERLATDAPDRPRMEAELAICRASATFLTRQMAAAQRHLQQAAESQEWLDDIHRGPLLIMQFQMAAQQGQWEQAEAFARQAIATSTRANDASAVINQRSEMALLLLYTGRGTAAGREIAEAIDAYPIPQPNQVLRVLQYTYVQAAEISYWLNNLDQVRAYARAAAQIGGRLGVDLSVNMAGQLLDLHNLARPEQADLEYARPRLLARMPNGMFPFSTMFEITYQIRSGTPENTLVLIDTWGITPETDPQTSTPERIVNYVAIQVALGRDLRRLDDMIARSLERFSQSRHLFFLCRLQAIEAWRQVKLGDKKAVQALAAAVETATRIGIVRPILDIPELAPLLAEVDHPGAARLITMMTGTGAEVGVGIYSLTPTELRVLKMLAQDYRYADIAAALSVSVNTIEKHIGSLYRKLNVKRRLAAVELAQMAGVLD